MEKMFKYPFRTFPSQPHATSHPSAIANKFTLTTTHLPPGFTAQDLVGLSLREIELHAEERQEEDGRIVDEEADREPKLKRETTDCFPELSSKVTHLIRLTSSDIPNLRVSASLYSFDVEKAEEEAMNSPLSPPPDDNDDRIKTPCAAPSFPEERADEEILDAYYSNSSSAPLSNEGMSMEEYVHQDTLPKWSRLSFAVEKLDDLIRDLFDEEDLGDFPSKTKQSAEATDHHLTAVPSSKLQPPVSEEPLSPMSLPSTPDQKASNRLSIGSNASAYAELVQVQRMILQSDLSEQEQQQTLSRLQVVDRSTNQIAEHDQRRKKRNVFKRVLKQVKKRFMWRRERTISPIFIAPSERVDDENPGLS